MASTLLTTRDTRADEEQALGLELLGAADGVGEVRVTTVNDNVTLLKMWLQLLDEVVDSRAGLDEEDDLTGTLEFGHKLLDGVSALDVGSYGVGKCRLRSTYPKISQPPTLCLVGEESVDLASGTVVGDDIEALVIHIQDKILALDLIN
jgi:hypothetical protein